jgi:transcriptional regulator with XRE-family HTH domain
MEGEQVSSPEQIGEYLGVSGPTIRRWEAGRSVPSHFDLQRFAEVCRLSPIETGFLIDAFSAKESEQPPDYGEFQTAAQQVLTLPFPAYLLDSFFFLRAWNSHMRAIDGPAGRGDAAVNLLRGPILAASRPNENEDAEHRLWRWLSDFWYSTASLCGSVPYRRLLQELSSIEGFKEKWRRMALERNPWQSWSFNSPYHYRNSNVGDYLVFPSLVVLPPTYHLRVYVPLDDLAASRVRGLGSDPTIEILPEIHWSSRLVKTV